QPMSSVLVIGAGKSGVAAANFLTARGERVILCDAKGELDLSMLLNNRVARAFGRDDAGLLDNVREVVLSPGVPLMIPLLQGAEWRGMPVTGWFAPGHRSLQGTVMATTGSTGKSPTIALIGPILRGGGRQPIVAGTIGEPLTAALDPDKPRVYVLELSSFQ